jgi:hypothetical protein
MKTIAKTWWFESGSNPDKKYETLQYEDGTTSCNCMGWCRRVDPNGLRSCKHTRMVQSGMADSECVKSLDGSNPLQAPAAKVVKLNTTPVKTKAAPARKILWNA